MNRRVPQPRPTGTLATDTPYEGRGLNDRASIPPDPNLQNFNFHLMFYFLSSHRGTCPPFGRERESESLCYTAFIGVPFMGEELHSAPSLPCLYHLPLRILNYPPGTCKHNNRECMIPASVHSSQTGPPCGRPPNLLPFFTPATIVCSCLSFGNQ